MHKNIGKQCAHSYIYIKSLRNDSRIQKFDCTFSCLMLVFVFCFLENTINKKEKSRTNVKTVNGIVSSRQTIAIARRYFFIHFVKHFTKLRYDGSKVHTYMRL